MDVKALNPKLVISATKYAKKLFDSSPGNYSGHDIQHTIRVYRNAIAIATNEDISDETVDINRIALSALLHDVDDYKIFDTKNNSNAKKFLKRREIQESDISIIINNINSVSFHLNSGLNPLSIEAQIVQDADRLDAIGAIGIARCFAYGGANHRTINESIQHFFDKLLLLESMMNTETAKNMAAERHEYMVRFIEECNNEQAVQLSL